MALAGFAPDEVEITATPRALIVKAARKTGSEEASENLKWSEFRRSDVCRYLPLPADIDVDKISANIKHGLLEVTVRKVKEDTEPKAKAAVDRRSKAKQAVVEDSAVRKPAHKKRSSKKPRAKKTGVKQSGKTTPR